MQSTITYTAEQFIKNMMEDFKTKLISSGNSQLANKVNNDTFTIKFYAKDSSEPVELEKFTIDICVD